jgi:hypothetical protein
LDEFFEVAATIILSNRSRIELVCPGDLPEP